MRILLATESVDFRKVIGGLASVCRNVLDADPFKGYLFVFVNKKKTSIKILVYDGQGLWLCQKRLSKGCFKFWPDVSDSKAFAFEAHQLQDLFKYLKTLQENSSLTEKNPEKWMPWNYREMLNSAEQ